MPLSLALLRVAALTSSVSSIRVIFSIADIQPEEDFEEEPETESEVDDPAPYPVRAALSITKVLSFLLLYRSCQC